MKYAVASVYNYRRRWSGVSKQFFLGVGLGALLTISCIVPYPNYLHIRSVQTAFVPNIDPGEHDKNEEFHRMENSTIADELKKQIRVLCWIMTGPANHKKRAKHVKATWGKRCNILLFMSTEKDDSLPTIPLPIPEGRNELWKKTKEAFKYVYKNYLDQADWFLKADDDTYVIVENLRYMLFPHKPSDPIYFGCRFKPYVKQGYMSGGAGYVLSRESVRRLVEDGFSNTTLCSPRQHSPEDIAIGMCLEGVNVTAGDSRDSLKRGRFFPFSPEAHLIPGYTAEYQDFWYWTSIYYQSKEGMNWVSDNAISFHYIEPNQMYVLEYHIYHLRPYGISYIFEMPKKPKDVI